jgi:hypothetical protein
MSYVRLETRMDAAHSFRHALLEARTPYFMWAAADDLWAQRFVGRFPTRRMHPRHKDRSPTVRPDAGTSRLRRTLAPKFKARKTAVHSKSAIQEIVMIRAARYPH